jgi:hypothetical protein
MQDLYGTVQSHAVSTFVWTCKLMEVLHPLLVEVYNPAKQRSRSEIASCLLMQKRALEEWSKELPDSLRIVDVALSEQSPPNHVVTLKYAIATAHSSLIMITDAGSSCLYYTTVILVHRPFLSPLGSSPGAVTDTEAMSACFSSASQICLILGLFYRSFGSSRCTMALAYSLYTAALIYVHKLESGMPIDDEDQGSLTYCIETLQDIANIHTGKRYLMI